MVKVVGLTEREIKEQDEISRLEKITRETLPHLKSSPGNISGIVIDDHENGIGIHAFKDFQDNYQISVFNKTLLQDAIILGEAYEKAGFLDVTVKKEYRE